MRIIDFFTHCLGEFCFFLLVTRKNGRKKFYHSIPGQIPIYQAIIIECSLSLCVIINLLPLSCAVCLSAYECVKSFQTSVDEFISFHFRILSVVRVLLWVRPHINSIFHSDIGGQHIKVYWTFTVFVIRLFAPPPPT